MAEPEHNWAQICDEAKRWVARNVVKLVVFFGILVLLAVTDAVKSVLGIIDIEDELKAIRHHLSVTEDTVYSYKYDYTLPHVTEVLTLLLKVKDPEEIGQFFGRSFQEVATDIAKLKLSDGQKKFLKFARLRLNDPVTRTFYFAAAKNTETTLYYEVACETTGGQRIDTPVTYAVKVNNHLIRPYTDWKGKDDLKRYWRNVEAVASKSDHHFYKQGLSFSIFGKPSDAEKILQLGIERCSFDAMIFVRDVHDVVPKKAGGVKRWLKRFWDGG